MRANPNNRQKSEMTQAMTRTSLETAMHVSSFVMARAASKELA